MTTRLLNLFTRTPLHVGAGSSVGAIDQPIIRERHTGFPIIPGSALKGVFADTCTEIKPAPTKDDPSAVKAVRTTEGRWLFGEESDAAQLSAGALQFSETRLLAFPVRSAKGSFAWLTSPLAIARAGRDGAIAQLQFTAPNDEQALFVGNGPLALAQPNNQPARIVLEEYTFTHAAGLPNGLGAALAALVADDPVWGQIAQRLVIVSDGMLSFFAKNACEVAQHVSIDDATGTAAEGKLFNQENVPSETLFYSVVTCFDGRGEFAKGDRKKTDGQALEAFRAKIGNGGTGVFQFGGDASTGLGFCTVCLGPAEPAATNANAA